MVTNRPTVEPGEPDDEARTEGSASTGDFPIHGPVNPSEGEEAAGPAGSSSPQEWRAGSLLREILEAGAGATDPESARRQLAEFLQAVGISEDEFRSAAQSGTLDVLVIERVLLPGGRKYSIEDAASLTGVPVEMVSRIWRSMGFPEPMSTRELQLTDEDVEMLSIAKRYMDRGVDPELLIQFIRTVGSALSRIADAEVAVVRTVGEVVAREEVGSRLASEGRPPAELGRILVDLVRERDAEIRRLLDYGHRRHLVFATRREISWQPGSRAGLETGVVGFADLVGFTAMSQQLDPADLAEMVERFGSLAYELVSSRGGRVVKMIGDEVMFVFDDPASAARASLDLAEAYSSDEELTSVRVGMASGELLVLDGDYYGPVVNLASRIVNIALAGTVVVSESLGEQLSGESEFVLRPMRPRRLKGIGVVRLWVLRRPGTQRPITARDLRQLGTQTVAEILGEGV